MLANQRRERILSTIQEEGFAKVSDLSRMFRVSEVTIRQDLEKIEKEGLISREHGGAFLKNIPDSVKNMELFNLENIEKKRAIGKKAAEFVVDGDTIILDSGSTTTEIAKHLTNRKNLTVITNSLNIALILGTNPGISVVLTGGEFKAATLSLTGQKAADFFSGINVDKLFLATAGISLKSGLTYPSISDLVVKRSMIEVANHIYLVADSTKIGKSAFASLGAMSRITCFVTDSGIKEDAVNYFREQGVQVVVA